MKDMGGTLLKTEGSKVFVCRSFIRWRNERNMRVLTWKTTDLHIDPYYLLYSTTSSRGTQRLFSVKYLFGEANIAYNFL